MRSIRRNVAMTSQQGTGAYFKGVYVTPETPRNFKFGLFTVCNTYSTCRLVKQPGWGVCVGGGGVYISIDYSYYSQVVETPSKEARTTRLRN